MSLGVFVRPDEKVVAAGGFVVQVMPGASEETIAQLEANVARATPVSQLVREGATPEEILAHVLDGFAPVIASEMSIRFGCRCSRERVLGTLVALGQDEICDLLAKEPRISVTCEFCSEQYVVDRREAEALFVASR